MVFHIRNSLSAPTVYAIFPSARTATPYTAAWCSGNVAAAVVALVFHRLARRHSFDVVPEPGSVEDGLVLHP